MSFSRKPFVENKDIKTSKLLSWLLRHGAESQGLKLDDAGFVDVQALLNLKVCENISLSDIKRVVEHNDKQRFTLRYNENENCLLIRANQGHSLKVNDDALLTLLTEENVPHTVYHGTFFSKLKCIREQGLNRMNRNHVHFASKLPTEDTGENKMRHNIQAVVGVDTLKAMKDGYKFYKSDNEVILCPGNDKGIIPPCYFNGIWKLSPFKKLE
ncbi:tRNA 2'-phosphotransferase 1 [Trichonephila clavata]|uniref:2'-phosphotransferase n=1 Tax=Trichonephila clavata TaxID=2740835 RepID=A0A8X6FKC3_TRICU|nr:tRNA 2'-phosphotransferase 1 [Trichonephila clavata]